MQAMEPILKHAIYDNMRVGSSTFRIANLGYGTQINTLMVADLGCGTWISTLMVANIIVKAMKENHEEMALLEFKVSFSDFPSNDFNSLLHMMPPYQ